MSNTCYYGKCAVCGYQTYDDKESNLKCGNKLCMNFNNVLSPIPTTHTKGVAPPKEVERELN